MQLLSCANLLAIIFLEVKYREVLIVVGGIVTMEPNVCMLPMVEKSVPAAPWPLQTRLVKAKLLKPGQKSNSRWAKYKNPAFAKPMSAAAVSCQTE